MLDHARLATRAERLSMVLAPLASILDLAIRLHVANVFFKSGLTKIESWEKTLFLFEYEYRVPFLSTPLAAFLGTFGELVFPVLLAIGLATRFSALSLSLVNVVAVVSYWHVLGENEAALSAHFYWGLLLLVTILHGPGRLSLDHFLLRRARGARSTAPGGRIASA